MSRYKNRFRFLLLLVISHLMVAMVTFFEHTVDIFTSNAIFLACVSDEQNVVVA